jgi:putative two-component system response regulator
MKTLGGFLTARILVVDDQESNVRLLERLLERWGYSNVISTTCSAEVPELFSRMNPDLLLLDLLMPPPDGFELLEELQRATQDDVFRPVLVLTADITRDARERALSLGASDFVNKPFDPIEVRLRIANLLETRRLTVELHEHDRVLEKRVLGRTRDLDQARRETLERLALAAEYRDDETHEHAQRVGRTAALMAVRLGISEDQVELIRRAAPLHDIGKIGISDTILLKPGKLTAAEFELIKTHTTIGAKILAGSESHVLQLSERIALTHHERWNGKGYLDGLAGEEIPLAARLVALADVFDALIHARPYKEAWSLDAVLAEIRLLAGSHFDPALVEIFETLDHDSLLAPIGSADVRDY